MLSSYDLRMLCLFGMIARLNEGNNILAKHARNMFASAKASSRSWFVQVQEIFLTYSLPHPITFLDNPPSKETYKRLVKAAVVDNWEKKLRGQAELLSSLKYFQPGFMSLSSPHPIYSTCGNSPYQVARATIQARYLSGRAKVEALTRHWDPSNKDGVCLLCRMINPTLGTIEHLLLQGSCPALVDARLMMLSFFQSYMVSRPYLLPIMKAYWNTEDHLTMQLLLDCSVLPDIIRMHQETSFPILKDIFYMSRSYIFKVHTTRRRRLEDMKLNSL